MTVPALAARIPIRHLVDHGPFVTTNKNAEQRYAAYAELYNKIGHTAVKAGDKIPIKGVDVQVVTAAGKVDFGDPKSGPCHVAFTPDGKMALVTRDGDHRISVLSVDGKGVMMRREHLRAETRKKLDARSGRLAKRRSKGEKRGTKRMARRGGAVSMTDQLNREELARITGGGAPGAGPGGGRLEPGGSLPLNTSTAPAAIGGPKQP